MTNFCLSLFQWLDKGRCFGSERPEILRRKVVALLPIFHRASRALPSAGHDGVRYAHTLIKQSRPTGLPRYRALCYSPLRSELLDFARKTLRVFTFSTSGMYSEITFADGTNFISYLF